MKTVREFEEDFEKLGPLMFGLHDGQSEAPKVNAKKVRERCKDLEMFNANF